MQKVQKAVGSVASAVADVGGFVWDHGGKEILAGSVAVGFIGAATFLGGPAGFAATTSIVIGAGLLDSDNNGNGGV